MIAESSVETIFVQQKLQSHQQKHQTIKRNSHFCQRLNKAKLFVPIQQISKYHSSIQIKERIRMVSKHVRAPILSTRAAIITTMTCKKL